MIGQLATAWLVAFVVAWKITRDKRIALAGATLIGVGLTIALFAANRRPPRE